MEKPRRGYDRNGAPSLDQEGRPGTGLHSLKPAALDEFQRGCTFHYASPMTVYL
jgi:hypothetical protein